MHRYLMSLLYLKIPLDLNHLRWNHPTNIPHCHRYSKISPCNNVSKRIPLARMNKNNSNLFLDQKTMSYLYSHVALYWFHNIVSVSSWNINGVVMLLLWIEIPPTTSASLVFDPNNKLRPIFIPIQYFYCFVVYL